MKSEWIAAGAVALLVYFLYKRRIMLNPDWWGSHDESDVWLGGTIKCPAGFVIRNGRCIALNTLPPGDPQPCPPGMVSLYTNPTKCIPNTVQ